MSVITATFRAISREGISPSGEVVELLGDDLNSFFDLLVEIEWLSGPKEGQTGWLLCSHYCGWPKELVNEADFLEGCFTPREMVGDSRLALGCHPTTVTSYDWKDDGVVEISTKVEKDPTLMSRTFQRGGEVTLPVCREFKLLTRVWKRFRRNSPLSTEETFSAFEQRQENGELVNTSIFVFSYVLAFIKEEGDIAVSPFTRASVSCPEYGDLCEVHGDEVRVVKQDEKFCPAQGYYRTPYNVEQGCLTVRLDIPCSNLWIASSIKEKNFNPLRKQDEGWEVMQEGNGYYPPEDLPYEVRKAKIGDKILEYLHVTASTHRHLDSGWHEPMSRFR